MSFEEKHFLDKISAISAKDINTVRDVMRGLLMASALEVHAGNSVINIPYICKLTIDVQQCEDKKKKETVVLTAEPNDTLIKEIITIKNGDTAPSEEHLKKEIHKTLNMLLEPQ